MHFKKNKSKCLFVNQSSSAFDSNSQKNGIAERDAIHDGVSTKRYVMNMPNVDKSEPIRELQNKLTEITIHKPKFGKQAPDRILMFHWGLNECIEGAVMLNEETAQSIVSSFVSQGNLIKWDMEHASVRKLPLEEQRS